MLLQSSQDNPQSQLTLTVPAEHGSLPSFSSPKLSKIIWCEPIFSHNLIPVPTLFHEKSVFETRPCYWPPPSFFTREIPELGQTGGIDVFHSLLLRIFFSFIWSWLETVSLSDVWHSYWKILFSSRANRHWMLDNIRRRQATLLAENCIRRSRSVIQVMTGCILPACIREPRYPSGAGGQQDRLTTHISIGVCGLRTRTVCLRWCSIQRDPGSKANATARYFPSSGSGPGTFDSWLSCLS